MVKLDTQKFVFPEGHSQSLPNSTDRQDAVIVDKYLDIRGKKVVDGVLVDKSQEELDEDLHQANLRRDENLKAYVLELIKKIVKDECQSKTGTKLYFSNTLSAVMHMNPEVQPDEEIRERAKSLVSWEILIDKYCVDVLTLWQSSGVTPDLVEFLEDLPTIT